MKAEHDRVAFIAGATSRIGIETMRQLHDLQIPVIAYVREGSEANVPAFPNLISVRSGSYSLTDLVSAMDGTTEGYVFPAIFARGHPKGVAYERAYQVNVDLPLAVQRAAERTESVGRIVYLSSSAVYGRQHGNVTEDAPLLSQDIYGVTKKHMEEKVLESADRVSPRFLRPGLTFGPGASIWTEGLFDVLNKKQPFLMGRGHGRLPLADIRDIANAAIHIANSPQADREAYNLVAEEDTRQIDIVNAYQLIVDSWIYPIPRFAASALGRVMDWKSRISESEVPISYEWVKQGQEENMQIRSEKAQSLGIQLRHFQETMRDSLLYLNEKFELQKEKVIVDFFQRN